VRARHREVTTTSLAGTTTWCTYLTCLVLCCKQGGLAVDSWPTYGVSVRCIQVIYFNTTHDSRDSDVANILICVFMFSFFLAPLTHRYHYRIVKTNTGKFYIHPDEVRAYVCTRSACTSCLPRLCVIACLLVFCLFVCLFVCLFICLLTSESLSGGIDRMYAIQHSTALAPSVPLLTSSVRRILVLYARDPRLSLTLVAQARMHWHRHRHR
jgi:hypothetical protein